MTCVLEQSFLYIINTLKHVSLETVFATPPLEQRFHKKDAVRPLNYLFPHVN